MKLFALIMSGLLLISQILCADFPEPYESTRNLPQTPFFVQDGYIYYSLINSRNAAVVVDVESEDGAVARFIAQQANNLPSLQKIYSVSGWLGSPAQKHQFQRFLSNVKQENTADKIIPIRMTSQEAAISLHITADFISLVGANDGNTIYKDILAWYPHLSSTGIICGNNWYDNSVQSGVTKAAEILDLVLNINNNVWYFVKNSP